MRDQLPFEDALAVLQSVGFKYGQVRRESIMAVVKDPVWQEYRKSMKGLRTVTKINMLRDWFTSHGGNDIVRVQVINYLNALKRGGQLY